MLNPFAMRVRGLDDLIRRTDAAGRQGPVGVAARLRAVAVSEAREFQRDAIRDMMRSIDKPDPRMRKALDVRRTPGGAEVRAVGRAGQILNALVSGDSRPGHMGMGVAESAQDDHGNIRGGGIRALLARGGGRRFFADINGTRGVWERKSSGGLRFLASLERRAHWRKTVDLSGEIREARSELVTRAKRILDRALAGR